MSDHRDEEIRDMLQPVTRTLGRHAIDTFHWFDYVGQALRQVLGDEEVIWHEAWCDAADNGLPVAAHLQVFSERALIELSVMEIERGSTPTIRATRRPLKELREVAVIVSVANGLTTVHLELPDGTTRDLPHERSLRNSDAQALLSYLRAACGTAIPGPAKVVL